MTEIRKRMRVLVVDDSAVQRQILIGLISRDADLEVVGWAANGVDALKAIARLKPDVMTLDEKMPGLSGVETAQRIMREAPTPIVMVTSSGGVRGREIADAAVNAGVLAVLDKRGLSPGGSSASSELLRVIKGMAEVRLVRRRRSAGAPADALPTLPRRARPAEVVAIGASTGGPHALRGILKRLPADFQLPILIVQHTTTGYAHTLAEWLAAETALPVSVAVDGQPLRGPGVLVAPTERHLTVEGRHIKLTEDAPCSFHRPSATVLFRSVATAFGSSAIGVLLTGMGDDGAAGLRELRDLGALTAAQDEASSVVFGMPAQAIRLGAAEHVLPPEGIAALLLDHAGSKGVAA